MESMRKAISQCSFYKHDRSVPAVQALAFDTSMHCRSDLVLNGGRQQLVSIL